MCADSTPADGAIVELQGRVERAALASGTKSAHTGMVLVLADGNRHVLRRAGGNAFSDPYFTAMEGRTVCLRGRLRPGFFLVEPGAVGDG